MNGDGKDGKNGGQLSCHASENGEMKQSSDYEEKSRTAEECGGQREKRTRDDEKGSSIEMKSESEPPSKRPLLSYKIRKYALFIAYSGAGFQGMQRNPDARTIEGELEDALRKVGAIREGDSLREIEWMRAARTDKGVSAMGQVVSARLIVDPQATFVTRVNDILPSEIRLMHFVRSTPSFDARGNCDRRQYEYLLPTFAFDPLSHRDREYLIKRGLIDEEKKDGESERDEEREEDNGDDEGGDGEKDVTRDGKEAVGERTGERNNEGKANSAEGRKEGKNEEGEKVKREEENGESDEGRKEDKNEALGEVERKNEKWKFVFGAAELSRLNGILSLFVGTHSFHNFTARMNNRDPGATRYVISFYAKGPFELEGIEFVALRVLGQSFILHQIRKMVGMAVAVMRGDASETFLTDAFRKDRKVNTPMAPELGLYLEECLYHAYNLKWAGTHPRVELFSMLERKREKEEEKGGKEEKSSKGDIGKEDEIRGADLKPEGIEGAVDGESERESTGDGRRGEERAREGASGYDSATQPPLEKVAKQALLDAIAPLQQRPENQLKQQSQVEMTEPDALISLGEMAEEFRRRVIYAHIARTEKREHTVAKWLSNLNDRNYPELALARAMEKLKREGKA